MKIDGQNVTVAAVKLPVSPTEEVADALAKYAGAERQDVSISTVGPTWGREVSRQGRPGARLLLRPARAVSLVPLRVKMAVAAIVAVIHDIIFTVGVYALFHFEVTPATITAFLTILGFSLYDTVVVFDKVRENQRDAHRDRPHHVRRDGEPLAEPGADAVAVDVRSSRCCRSCRC